MAFVLGASMGGMIAQELYFRHPERVRALLLGCSGPSGLRSKLPDFERLRALRRAAGITREEREWLLARILYSDDTERERIGEDIQVRLRHTLRLTGALSQLTAILTWSSYSRLPRIRVPTLVLHGDRDYLVPLDNGRLLARRIPGAELTRGSGRRPRDDHRRTRICRAGDTAFSRETSSAVGLAAGLLALTALTRWPICGNAAVCIDLEPGGPASRGVKDYKGGRHIHSAVGRELRSHD